MRPPRTATLKPQLTSNSAGVIMPRVMTPEGVAQYLGCSTAYIRDLLSKGLLRGYHLGGPASPWRIEREDFLAYIAAQKQRATQGALHVVPSAEAAS